ncbi:MAG TPA: heme ABC transporter ATP-binding protein [Clostridiales bacterium]|nr:heme ABC transporter ATP-binding protein [Clostridiales bacterium]
MDYEVKVENLYFFYGETNILEDINLSFQAGSFISIIGPNGSGKSTFLKNLSRYLEPQKGIVLLGGKDINQLSKKEISRNVSVVPQNILLEFDFKVKDIVMMGRHPYVNRWKGETEEDREIVEKAMKYTNILHFSDRSYNELSGGEKQRVILAQALAQQPKVLLLDEPISHLDLQYQVEILDLVKRLTVKEGMTVISVLHDLNMASGYSDKIIMLKDGKVYCQGKPEEVLTAENIAHVFNTNVSVSKNPVTGKTYVYPISVISKKKRKLKVHIICGGGTGVKLIQELATSGFHLSAGVLNIGDSDWAISKEYELDVAEEVPFMSISHEAYMRNLELAEASDILVLLPVYLSKLNILNIKLLADSRLDGKKIYIVEDSNLKKRDFTNGEAIEIYKELLSKPNVEVIKEDELKEILIKADDNHG